jgi:hypothetical protein
MAAIMMARMENWRDRRCPLIMGSPLRRLILVFTSFFVMRIALAVAAYDREDVGDGEDKTGDQAVKRMRVPIRRRLDERRSGSPPPLMRTGINLVWITATSTDTDHDGLGERPSTPAGRLQLPKVRLRPSTQVRLRVPVNFAVDSPALRP